MVVLQGMRPMAAALALGRVMSNLLFQVSSHDPIVFAAVVASLAAVSLIACYWPARTATRANPSDVLRYE
jgi:putative ABC transport system permease protein